MRICRTVSIVRLSAVASCVVAASVATQAHAASCGGAAIGARFSEAARLCDAPAAAPVASVPIQSPAVQSVAFETPGTVSVSMPGYRQRLATAQRAVRASGATPTSALIAAVAQRYRINPHLLASMMHTESRGRQRAVSNKGALGLMQLMPATARSMGVRDPRAMLDDPVLAISTGAAYLKTLQRQLGNDVPLVVAAYNAGPGAVMKAGRRIPRYRETQGYVRQVLTGYSAATTATAR